MNDLHLGPSAQHRKSAKIAGDTSGNYHPHGEEVIYPDHGPNGAGLQASATRSSTARATWDPSTATLPPLCDTPKCECLRSRWRCSTTSKRTPSIGSDNYDQTRLEPDGAAGQVPEPAGKRHRGDRGRLWLPRCRRTTSPSSATASSHLIDNPDATLDEHHAVHQGPGFPDLGPDSGHQGHPRPPTRPAAARS